MEQKIEERTFGGTPAAIKLANIMNEHNIPSHKVGRFLSNFNRTLNELTKIDTKIGVGLAKIVYLNHCESTKYFPIEISTYVRNVISTKFKVWMVEQNGQMPYKTRKEWR